MSAFSSLREPVNSTPFNSGSSGHRWMLRLYPQGEAVACADHLSLYIYLVSAKSTEVPTVRDVRLSLEDSTGAKCQAHSFRHSFGVDDGQGYSKFVARALLFKNATRLLPDDALTLCCRLRPASDKKLAKSMHSNYSKLSGFTRTSLIWTLETLTAASILGRLNNVWKFSFVHKEIVWIFFGFQEFTGKIRNTVTIDKINNSKIKLKKLRI